VRKADACLESGEIGVLLRREGLYSSHLTHWRREYRQGAELALADNKRGRKCTKLAVDLEVEKLRLQLERTEKKLKQAEMVIEFQKKLCEILGISPPSVSKGGE
jgi:transposase-like protein